MSDQPTIAIRLAHADEDVVLFELAELDSAAHPQRPALLALVDGRPVAALELSTGAVVADPFAPTTDAVALLRARRRQLAARAGDRDGRRGLALLRGLIPARASAPSH